MAVTNSLATGNQPRKLGITAYLSNEAVKNQIEKVVGGERSTRFISSVVSAVNVNPALAECENGSILSAALLGEALNLSPSPQLGHYYMVPFNDKKKGIKSATFQLGYKGYVQLAIRSGQYKKLNVIAVKEGELEYFDPLNEEIKINLRVEDWDAREGLKTIGYYAMFELVNGFRKAIYWSKEQMINHADRYSQAFSKEATSGKYPKVSFADYEAKNYPSNDEWLYSSFWYKDFDGMAYKTMLRQLISKWGIMSIDMQSAFENDMTFRDEKGNAHYAENDIEIVEVPSVKEDVQPNTETAENALFDDDGDK